jgi:hypothetical protein
MPIRTIQPTIDPRLSPLLHLSRNFLVPSPMYKPHYEQQQRNTDAYCNSDYAACRDWVQLFLVELWTWVADVRPRTVAGSVSVVFVDGEGFVCDPGRCDSRRGAFDAVCGSEDLSGGDKLDR